MTDEDKVMFGIQSAIVNQKNFKNKKRQSTISNLYRTPPQNHIHRNENTLDLKFSIFHQRTTQGLSMAPQHHNQQGLKICNF